ncbi:hypothetical protein Tco_1472430, partial [Tanacetum coccineum]
MDGWCFFVGSGLWFSSTSVDLVLASSLSNGCFLVSYVGLSSIIARLSGVHVSSRAYSVLAEDGTIIKHWHPYFIPDELRHKLEEAGRQLAADASASKSHEFNNSGSNVPNLFLMKLGDGCGR